MPPTPEQQACIDAFLTGDNLTIEAGAGTGKTTTLKGLSAQTNRRGLYLAYNKAIATDAAKSFPRNVECKTGHSLAWGWAARTWGRDLLAAKLNTKRVPPREVARIIGSNEPVRVSDTVVLSPQMVARVAMETITRYCYTGDPLPTAKHMPQVNGVEGWLARHELGKVVEPLARAAWEILSNPADTRLKFTHDAYLKLFTLAAPQLPYDFLLVDEAQDSNGCVTSLIQAQQHTQVVAVGDSCQSIYGWRGAMNAMGAFNSKQRLFLSQSFRFGQAVADEANKFLTCLDADLRLTGRPDKPSRLDRLGGTADAVLCRTNAVAFETLLDAQQAGTRVAIAGGGTELLRFAEAAEQLKATGYTSHFDLAAFTSWGQVQDYVRDAADGADLAVMVRLIDTYTPAGVISALNACVEPAHAALTVSTAHKAKGLEWGKVRIADDFKEPLDADGLPVPVSREDGMLAYVAVTRAMDVLDRGSLAWVDKQPALTGRLGEFADVDLSDDDEEEPPLCGVAHKAYLGVFCELPAHGDERRHESSGVQPWGAEYATAVRA